MLNMKIVSTTIVVLALYVLGCCSQGCSPSGDYILSDVTGHYYRVIQCFNESWAGANAYAQTLVHPQKGQGYLMTIQDYDEQNLIFARPLPHPSSVDVFLGGIDATGARSWYWTGPESAINFYNTLRGCTAYCNFAIGEPTTPSGPQGLRLRGTTWVTGSTTEELEWAFGFVEFGCCDCALNGVCNETSCTCTCADDFIGPHCDVYIGACADPGAPICTPATPICVKPSATSAPTPAPTSAPTPAPCSVTVIAVLRDGYSYQVGTSGIGGVYDIVVVNTGSQAANRAYFDISFSSTGTITTWWMFSRAAPTYIDLPSLAPGSSYSQGGFVFEDPSSSSLSVSLTYNYAVC